MRVKKIKTDSKVLLALDLNFDKDWFVKDKLYALLYQQHKRMEVQTCKWRFGCGSRILVS